MQRLSTKAAPLVLALAAAGFGGAVGNELILHNVHAAQTAAVAAQAAPVPAVPAATTLPDFARITERYGPAVVNISVSGTRKMSAQDMDPGEAMDPFELFRRFQQLQRHHVQQR